MRNNNYLDKKIQYIRDVFANEDEILLNIRNEAKKINREITINPEEGKLLQLLINIGNYEKVLEIGTFLGYSTLWMARAKENIKIYTIEKDLDIAEKTQKNFKSAHLENKIDILKGKAEDILLNFNEKIDMVFIDAEKNHYLDYLDLTEKLVRKGGLVVADNSLLSGAVYEEELPYRIRESTKKSMELFNKRLADEDKYLSILLPAEDGLTVAMKK